MKSLLFPLAVPVLAVVTLLALTDTASATIFRRGRARAVAYRPVYPSGHMPGWDWQRIYPWSPYNYGRNPYNPIIVPSYVNPQPVYVNPTPVMPAAPAVVTYSPVSVSPTPHTGVVRVTLPDTFAQVQFNGQVTPGVGSTRYYVTPPLSPGQVVQYNVSATWTGNVGQTVYGQHNARVMPGQTTVIYFGR
jgi:uncharacterized protein (TIGR03000 family)